MVVVAVAIGFVVGFVGTNLMEGEDKDDDEEEEELVVAMAR